MELTTYATIIEVLAAHAEQYKVPAFKSLTELLAQSDCDMVIYWQAYPQ